MSGRFSPRIGGYMLRRHAEGLLLAFAGLTTLLLVGDFLEYWRRAAGREAAAWDTVAGLTVLHLPALIEHFLPLVVLAGSIITFRRVARHGELVSIRAAGLSWLQLLLPGVLLAAGLGGFWLAVGNPVSAATQDRLDRLEARHFRGEASRMVLSGSGFWIRQSDSDGDSIVHAATANPADMLLEDVVVFRFDAGGRFRERINARAAQLVDTGHWQLVEGVVVDAGQNTDTFRTHFLESGLTRASVGEGFTPPEVISLWRMPQYVALLEQYGFPTRGHRMQFHGLLTTPVVLAGMVLLAAAFLVPRPGTARLGFRFSGLLAAGVLFFVLREIARAYGQATDIPVPLAAWAPAVLPAAFGVAAILHFEDG